MKKKNDLSWPFSRGNFFFKKERKRKFSFLSLNVGGTLLTKQFDHQVRREPIEPNLIQNITELKEIEKKSGTEFDTLFKRTRPQPPQIYERTFFLFFFPDISSSWLWIIDEIDNWTRARTRIPPSKRPVLFYPTRPIIRDQKHMALSALMSARAL